MLKNILSFLKCCKSKQRQLSEEIDIQIICEKEIKKILCEYKIEDRDFDTFSTEKTSTQSSNIYNDINKNDKNSYKSISNLNTELIGEIKEHKVTDSINFITNNEKNNSKIKNNHSIDKNLDDYKEKLINSEEQILINNNPTIEIKIDIDEIIVSDNLIREEEKNLIKFVNFI